MRQDHQDNYVTCAIIPFTPTTTNNTDKEKANPMHPLGISANDAMKAFEQFSKLLSDKKNQQAKKIISRVDAIEIEGNKK